MISALPFASPLLFVATLACAFLGWRIGRRELARDPGGAHAGTAAIEGAVFGLLGLLIAFTFSGAGERMNVRRGFVVDEANAIGTAWLRLDLLDEADAAALRPLFRDYADARIAMVHEFRPGSGWTSSERRAGRLANRIWSRAMAGVRRLPDPVVGTPLVEALNAMIDLGTSRSVAMRVHPPIVVYLLLVLLTLIAATLLGYGMAGRTAVSRLHLGAYAFVMAATLFVIVDFEFPRFGIIRVDSVDVTMRDVRRAMGD